jgi:pilus assembly protein Flp/PilA
MQQSVVRLFLGDDSGATSIEYALIASGISIVIVATANRVGGSLIALFNTLGTAFGG